MDGMIGLEGLLFVMDDDERERRMYGRGGSFWGSTGDATTGEAGGSAEAGCSKVSPKALGGGLSTIASRSCKIKLLSDTISRRETWTTYLLPQFLGVVLGLHLLLSEKHGALSEDFTFLRDPAS